ncbi:L-rhamnose mutarotase [Leifsonia poae]|uniref:L-rhamnose mutarotase n=1 Tax=Leifsonia poae TaxID=110933 RepID=UPI001CC1757C|nr:L-rhamnose mutarotase [Leifsonia poae]
MRIALHSVLRDGHEAGYDEAHSTVPLELVDTFDRVGIHEWTIWRSGRDLFHLVECDDFVAAMDALSGDPADQRWQAFIGRFVDHFATTGSGSSGLMLGQVWSLGRQRGATLAPPTT